MQNPWPGKAVRVTRNGVESETLTGERFSLKTSPGEVIPLAPAEPRREAQGERRTEGDYGGEDVTKAATKTKRVQYGEQHETSHGNRGRRRDGVLPHGAGEETRLEDLSNFDLVENSDKAPLKDQSASWKPLQMAGQKFQHGLGTHAPFKAMIRLDGHTEKFHAVVGLSDLNWDPGLAEYIVTGDGKVLFRSGPMKGGVTKDGRVITLADKPKVIDLDLNGVKRLLLEVTAGRDNNWGDDANWADGMFTWKGEAPRIVEIVDDACGSEAAALPVKSPADTTYPVDSAKGGNADEPQRAMPQAAQFRKNTAPAAPIQLAVEGVRNPLGIDNPAPVFSWASAPVAVRGQRQGGYQIIMASSRKAIDVDKGDVWSVCEKRSAQQSGIVYAGPALASKTRYWWKVRVRNTDGIVSPYSQPAIFETAMMKSADWKAQWIGGDFTRLRKEFNLDKSKTIAQRVPMFRGKGIMNCGSTARRWATMSWIPATPTTNSAPLQHL